jgi:hypothetical protein
MGTQQPDWKSDHDRSCARGAPAIGRGATLMRDVSDLPGRPGVAAPASGDDMLDAPVCTLHWRRRSLTPPDCRHHGSCYLCNRPARCVNREVIHPCFAEDALKFARPVEMPSQTGSVALVPSREALSHRRQVNQQATYNEVDADRILVARTFVSALYDASQHQSDGSGVEVIPGDCLQVAQHHREVEPIIRRERPRTAKPVQVDDRVGDPCTGEQVTNGVRHRCLARPDSSGNQQCQGRGTADVIHTGNLRQAPFDWRAQTAGTGVAVRVGRQTRPATLSHRPPGISDWPLTARGPSPSRPI